MKMSRKAVFFDADGTVCDMKKGVPDSAILREDEATFTYQNAIYYYRITYRKNGFVKHSTYFTLNSSYFST